MKDVRAKRAFLIALTAAMALITLLYAGRSVDREMAVERQYPRKNAALSMHLEQGGVIRIEGEGKLYYNDLKAMLRQADIKIDDVRDVIVGDGIDEIGYLTFNHLKSLRTLKLGSGVRRVAPGAIKDCESLEWLYFPSSLKDVAADFLYLSKQCRLVTDGEASDLPSLANVRGSERKLTGIDAIDALRAAVGDGVVLPDALALWWR
jgi:hypothetical protein